MVFRNPGSPTEPGNRAEISFDTHSRQGDEVLADGTAAGEERGSVLDDEDLARLSGPRRQGEAISPGENSATAI